ncbi:BLUF domain-containing protein [Henriciella litoralis]|uniref:BLUF domain-containing protein n=1 Tax=Henriciella litoralis TaxID=568102 RepID=UPI000A009616|nr:BLUF domain-containing protein [Henriciella litoralis]
MKRLIYISRPRHTLTPDSVQDILASARNANREARVTGLLVHVEGMFLQVLEGQPEALAAAFARVRRDWRHADCQVLFHETVPQRLFEGWPLAYRAERDLELKQTRQIRDIREIAAMHDSEATAFEDPALDLVLRAFLDSFSALAVH